MPLSDPLVVRDSAHLALPPTGIPSYLLALPDEVWLRRGLSDGKNALRAHSVAWTLRTAETEAGRASRVRHLRVFLGSVIETGGLKT
jgi:hypothetical protein